MAVAILFPFIALISAGAAAAADPPTPFVACEAMVRQDPGAQQSYLCFYREARRRGMLDEGARRLERLSTRPGVDRGWAQFVLALIATDRGQAVAEQGFTEAAESFTVARHAEGIVLARVALARFLRLRARIDEARRQAEMAEPLAASSGNAILSARVAIERAFIAYNEGDYGLAWRRLKDVEATTFSSGPVDVQSAWLAAMGATCWATHRGAESLSAYRRQAELLHEAGDIFGEVTARDNILFLLSGPDMPREELATAARRTLEAAEQTGNSETQARALVYLADATSGEEALAYSRRALVLARDRAPGSIAVARRATAARLVFVEPDEAFRLIDEAIAEAGRHNDLGEVARNWVVRSDMRWTIGPRSAAIADALEAIEAAEAIRTLQPEGLVRARRFSAWSAPFDRLVGHLMAGDLTGIRRPSESDLEMAFSVTERRRARMLVDELDGTRPASDRGSRRPSPPPTFSSLGELRASLTTDDAVLVFHVSSKAGDPSLGGPRLDSWLMAHSHDGTKVYEIPSATELETSASLLTGLFARRDDSERAGARRLYAILLQRAIADLRPEVRRLVIVPDAALFSVPFAALQDGSGQALGARFEISTVPSATTWLAWRRQSGDSRPAVALALADPAVTVDRPTTTDRRVRDAAGLGPLPQARREAQAVRRSFGESTVRVGTDASERFIKTTDLRRLTLLHFAAHGLLDDAEPDRSAILLAPGSDGEDGLLQAGEIANLHLAGVVVLSACRSASGTLLSGEGVMGLAHAFFQAGAQTVVASLWPLRDDEAAEMFQVFYDNLGKGSSVNAALRAARVDAISRGRPGAAWAGIVTLGNGDIVPIPGGTARRYPGRVAGLITILISLLFFVLRLLARRKSVSNQPSPA
jgi:CHAT domain-containing protein/tetratricopeptide (TPR) repeat protein